MDRRTILETDRLRLETWLSQPHDFEDLYELHSDPRVQPSYSPGPEKWTRQGLTSRFSEYLSEQEHHGLTKWRAVLKDGTFVGRAGWSPWYDDALEIGYAFKPEFWGKGLASEVTRALITWAQSNRPECQLVGFALEDNQASRHILEKSGFALLDFREIGGITNAYYLLTQS